MNDDPRDLDHFNRKTCELVESVERLAFGLAAEPQLEEHLPRVSARAESLQASYQGWRRAWSRAITHLDTRELFSERIGQELHYINYVGEKYAADELADLRTDEGIAALLDNQEVERDMPAMHRLMAWLAKSPTWSFDLQKEALEEEWPLFLRTERVHADVLAREAAARRALESELAAAKAMVADLKAMFLEYFNGDQKRVYTLLSGPRTDDYGYI